VAVVNRVGYEGNPAAGDPGIEFWGNSFVADPFARSSRKPAAKKKKFSSLNATRQKAKTLAAIGLSCAIAALTPTNPFSIAGSANDFVSRAVSVSFALCVLNASAFENHA